MIMTLMEKNIQPGFIGKQNAPVNVTDSTGRVITNLVFPSDPLRFHVIKNVIAGNEYRCFPPNFSEPMIMVDFGANVGAL